MKTKLFLTLLLLLIPSICFGAAATMYVTVAGAGDNSGDSWANAMSYSDWETDMEGSAEAGDIYYVAGGTYTLTSDMNASTLDGTGTNNIKVIGVKSGTTNEGASIVFSDWAFGTDRPLIAGGSYAFKVGDYWQVRNIRMTSTANQAMYLDSASLFNNCYLDYSSSNSSSIGFYMNGALSRGIYNEVNGNNAGAKLTRIVDRSLFYGNYFHDSSRSCIESQGTTIILNNVIDTCGESGITANDRDVIIGNTFYNMNASGAEALDISSDDEIVIYNNLFDTVETAIVNGAAYDSNLVDHNVYSNTTTDTTNVTKGNNAVTEDISLTDPSNGDFTLPDSTGAEDAGLQVDSNVGITGDYNVNIGADQTDTQIGGATRRFIMITGNYDLDMYLNNIDPRIY